MKTKAKQFLCMVCVFVASFMLTVTAYAYIDVDYSQYGGKYRADTSVGGYISISEKSISIVVYKDNNNNCYVGGTTPDGYILSPSSRPFYALFDSVYKCNTDGSPTTYPPVFIPDYEATGKLSTIGKKTIISDQSKINYIKV